jgi:hypothetical protein
VATVPETVGSKRKPPGHLTLTKQSASRRRTLKAGLPAASLAPTMDDARDEARVSEPDDRSGIRAKGEEALGDLAQALLDNPVFNQAMATALGAGERAVQAQRNAMSAVGVPSAADMERLERRIRSVSGRLEAIEDRIDEVAEDLAAVRKRVGETEEALADQEGVSAPGPGTS